MTNMKFLSVRELRASTSKLKAMLADDGKIVLTTSGKPAALLLEVNETSLEELLFDLRQLQAKRALKLLRDAAEKRGTAGLSETEINTEITAARRELHRNIKRRR
jgi:antitoxin (DNA-binding transcriptional repressor) of toxin-antitoxin stability system